MNPCTAGIQKLCGGGVRSAPMAVLHTPISTTLLYCPHIPNSVLTHFTPAPLYTLIGGRRSSSWKKRAADILALA